MAPTKVKKEKILQDYGLHNIEVRLKAVHCQLVPLKFYY